MLAALDALRVAGLPGHLIAEEEGSEGRGVAWLAEDEAIQRLTFDEHRAVLTRGCARLEQSRGIV